MSDVSNFLGNTFFVVGFSMCVFSLFGLGASMFSPKDIPMKNVLSLFGSFVDTAFLGVFLLIVAFTFKVFSPLF